MKLSEIAQQVLDRLNSRSREIGDYRFEINQEISFQDDESLWHVYVVPDRTVDKRGQFYDILNDIEEEFETSQRENVMLVPVKPETTTSENEAKAQ